jgi:hypothetical protein
MWQWIILIVFIISLGIGGILFFGPSKSISTPGWIDSVVKFKEDILGERSVSDYPEELVDESKDSLREEIKNKTGSVVEVINQKASDVLGEDVEVEVVETQDVEQGSQVISFTSGKKLSLKKGVMYSLKFPDIPNGQCVFINGQKYQVGEGEVVQIKFTSSGAFPLKIDYCSPTEKSLGEVVVE